MVETILLADRTDKLKAVTKKNWIINYCTLYKITDCTNRFLHLKNLENCLDLKYHPRSLIIVLMAVKIHIKG